MLQKQCVLNLNPSLREPDEYDMYVRHEDTIDKYQSAKARLRSGTSIEKQFFWIALAFGLFAGFFWTVGINAIIVAIEAKTTLGCVWVSIGSVAMCTAALLFTLVVLLIFVEVYSDIRTLKANPLPKNTVQPINESLQWKSLIRMFKNMDEQNKVLKILANEQPDALAKGLVSIVERYLDNTDDITKVIEHPYSSDDHRKCSEKLLNRHAHQAYNDLMEWLDGLEQERRDTEVKAQEEQRLQEQEDRKLAAIMAEDAIEAALSRLPVESNVIFKKLEK